MNVLSVLHVHLFFNIFPGGQGSIVTITFATLGDSTFKSNINYHTIITIAQGVPETMISVIVQLLHWSQSEENCL